MSEPHFDRINPEPAKALNPWSSMWLHPRLTLRYLLETNPRYAVIPLAMAAGVTNTNFNSENTAEPILDKIGLLPLLIGIVVLGAISGIIGLYIFSWLTRWCGSWLGGRATSEQLRTVLAWGSLPSVWQLLPLLILVVTLGSEMFTSETPNLDSSLGLIAILLICGAVSFVLGIWSMVLVVAGVAEVQGFSAWRAIGNLILPGLILFAIVFVFFIIIMIPIAILSGS